MKGKSIEMSAPNLRRYIGLPVMIKLRDYNDYVEDEIEEVMRKNVCLKFRGWVYVGAGLRDVCEKIGFEIVKKEKSFKVIYRKGYPSKKSLYKLVNMFDSKMWRLSVNIDGSGYYWSHSYVDENIHRFIDWATEEHGIEFGKMRGYKPPCYGILRIKKREK